MCTSGRLASDTQCYLVRFIYTIVFSCGLFLIFAWIYNLIILSIIYKHLGWFGPLQIELCWALLYMSFDPHMYKFLYI